jgi:predicted nucleic acid-binding protein
MPVCADRIVIDSSLAATWCFGDEASYDAAYLELAIRAGLPLATHDQALADAAIECGVSVLPKP